MARRKRVRPSADHWLLSLLLLVAMGVAAAGWGSVLSDVRWWFVFMAVALVVLLAAAIVRSTGVARWWATVAGAGAAVASMTAFFAPQTALLGFIPTFSTFAAFRELELAGTVSIASQDIPADAGTGIVYLLCWGAAGIALILDALAHQFRVPALTGVPLAVLVLVPSFVRPELGDAFFFALTALAWLAIMLVTSRPRRFAIGTAAAALAAALLLPLALPAIGVTQPTGTGGVFATGVNPIITLGNDLRRADPTLALTYTTSADTGQYLRLTVLDDFSGQAWAPTPAELVPTNDVGSIGPVPGLAEGVPRDTVVTDVTVASILSRWLPVPYAPSSVTGLDGTWAWEADGLSIRSEDSNARNQAYEVQSVTPAPSIEQLVAAGTSVEPGLERYLVLPEDLPPVVASTALAVVGAAADNYDRALALQAYFRDGTFTYSEDAPVEQDFDGSGASVLAAFLEVKAGYCVHFSSAMAAMARTLGIPARVAVGFTPGEPVTAPEGDAVIEYRVSTDNLHAWPELYFAGIGWVRFEPTPGRGVEPAFAPLAQDDPATPDVDESVPVPSPTPTVAPTTAPSSAPSLPPEDTASGGTDATVAAPIVVWPWFVAVAVALALTPLTLRILRRNRRLAAVRDGSALDSWIELRDTASDLGLNPGEGRTPRQFAADLAEYLDDSGAAALARLRGALEAESFAASAGVPAVADVRAVLRALRRGAGLGATVVAMLAPRSLMPRRLSPPLVE